jgi:hypothetical protein
MSSCCTSGISNLLRQHRYRRKVASTRRACDLVAIVCSGPSSVVWAQRMLTRRPHRPAVEEEANGTLHRIGCAWLYEVLQGHVRELVVTHAYERKRGPKDNQRDAFHLAESLRLGAVSPVYKNRGQLSELRAHADVYAKLVTDLVRAQNRLKALFPKKIRPWLATTGPRPSSPGEVTRIPFHLPSEASGGVGPPIQPTGVVEAVRTRVNPRSRTQCVTAALVAEPQDTRLGCGQPLRARPAPRPMTHPHPPGALREARASVSSGPGCKRPRVLRFECP